MPVGVGTNTMKSIHVICHYIDKHWEDLTPAEGAPGTYLSKCWIITEGDPNLLKHGFLYLHESSNKPAGFGSRILDVQPCRTRRDKPGFAFTVRRIPSLDGQRWRGGTPNQAVHHGGIVEANLPEEVAED